MENLNSTRKPNREGAQQVLAAMTQWRIPLSPENYHIWYDYVLGDNPGLRAAIDAVIHEGGAFTREVNKELYRNYVGELVDLTQVKQAQQETCAILKHILAEVLATGNFASEYGDNLSDYSRQLGTAHELAQIQRLVRNMITDTAKMAESSRNLQNKLDEARQDAERLKQQLDKAQEEATTDPLTRLHNRKAAEKRLRELYEEFHSSGACFSVIMADVDHFKRFNDTHGHQVGDALLRMVGIALNECVKGRDFASRYGGEEFLVLLPKTELDKACIVAEQIRERVAGKEHRLVRTGERVGRMTISLGVAEIGESDTTDSLIARADRALYFAKGSGRNNSKSELDLEAMSAR